MPPSGRGQVPRAGVIDAFKAMRFPGLPSHLEEQLRINLLYRGRDVDGRPFYTIQYKIGNQVTRSETWAYQSGASQVSGASSPLVKPNLRQGGSPASTSGQSSGGGARGTSPELEAAKDKWLSTIVNLPVSDIQKGTLRRAVERYRGSVDGFNRMMADIAKRHPLAAPQDTQAPIDQGFGFDFGGFGGGGGGAAEPVYRAPDRRVVEDMAKGMMVSYLGTIPDNLVEAAVDVYMKDHRRNWESETEEISPEQSLLEFIENTEEYQSIHELRPESVDARNWVAERRAAAGRGGLDVEEQEQFAINQAQVGGDVPDVEEAAAFTQLQRSRSAQGTPLQDKLRNVMSQVMQGARF